MENLDQIRETQKTLIASQRAHFETRAKIAAELAEKEEAVRRAQAEEASKRAAEKAAQEKQARAELRPHSFSEIARSNEPMPVITCSATWLQPGVSLVLDFSNEDSWVCGSGREAVVGLGLSELAMLMSGIETGTWTRQSLQQIVESRAHAGKISATFLDNRPIHRSVTMTEFYDYFGLQVVSVERPQSLHELAIEQEMREVFAAKVTPAR